RREKMPEAEIGERVGQMLKLTKLEEFAHRKPHQLSGGQRQRVALARAVAKRPKLLLLDEPLGALDKKLREETQFELMDLQQELGLTFMIVTHDQEEAMTMSDRIAVMDKGMICQVGTPAEIYEAPGTRYVADFIGSVNMFEGSVQSSAKGVVTLDGADGFAIKAAHDNALAKDKQAWFAVRPEKVEVSRTKPKQGFNMVEGEVWDIAYLGDVTIYNVKLDSGKIAKATVLNTERIVENPIGYEDRVWLSFETTCGTVLER
ncbi:MAG: ABC transporter ATP-binding protein, partial [Pseudomonadota bacterium]